MAFNLPKEAIDAAATDTPAPQPAAPAAGGFSLPKEAVSASVDDLVADEAFDPISYALDNPNQRDLAEEVAFKKSQLPFTKERAKKIPGLVAEGAKTLVKDFGTGLGEIAADTTTILTPGETQANKERAETQQMARAQLIENNTATFFNKLFGPNTFLGKLFEGGGANVAVAQAMMAGPNASSGGVSLLELSMREQQKTKERIAEREANPREAFKSDFSTKLDLARTERELLKGNVQDTGAVAEAVQATGSKPSEIFRSGEALKEMGAPVSAEAISTGAVAADPMNLLPMNAPKVVPLLNKGVGKVLQGTGKAVTKTAEAATTGTARRLGKYGLGAAGGALGVEAVRDPESALKTLGVGAGIVAGAKGAKLFGQVLESAGSKLVNPKAVSATEKAAAKELMNLNARGAKPLEKMISPKLNAADSERAAGRFVQGVTTAPAGMLPALAAAETPEEGATMIGGGVGFGALGGMTNYSPTRGFRPETVQAVDAVLRDQGAKKKYGTDVDAKHDAYVQNLPEEVRDGVNAYRGFFDGFKINGKEPQIYVLGSEEFGKELQKLRPDLSPEQAQAQRGAASKDGRVLINGDYGGEAAGILGHESGHLVTESIMQVLAPELSKSLADKAAQGLMKNGRPTAKLRKFVAAYNREFDPTGKTKEIETTNHAISEWLAEQSRSVLEGEGPAKFAAGESVRQQIADNVGDYFKGVFGTKNTFAREEIPGLANEYRDLLFEMGRLGTRLRGGEDLYAGMDNPIPADQVPPATPDAAPAPETPARSPEEVNRAARFQTLDIEQAAVDSARDKAMKDAVDMEKRRRGKRPISEKSEAEVAEQAGREFDAQLETYLKALETEGVGHPQNLEISQAVMLNQLAPESNLPRWRNWAGRERSAAEPAQRVVEEPPEGEAYPYLATSAEKTALERKGWTADEIKAMPESQVRREVGDAGATAPAEAPLAGFGQPDPTATLQATPAAEKPRIRVFKDPETGEWRQREAAPAETAPEARPQLDEAAIIQRVQQAEEAARQAEAGKKRKTPESREKATAQAVKEARVRALLDAATESAADPSQLQRREEYGVEKFTGKLDEEIPAHRMLLDELGVSLEARDNIDALQANMGKVVYITYKSASKQVQSETAGQEKAVDRSGKQRAKEYKAEDVDARIEDARKGDVSVGTEQVKAFYPMGFRVNPSTGSVTVTGFSPQRLLSNAGKIIDFLKGQGRETGYEGPTDPQISKDINGYAQNHANGWRGDGSAPLKGEEATPDYQPYQIDATRFDLLNAALANESAKTPKINREGAKEKAAEAQKLALENFGFMEAGETNKLRDFINKSGKFTFTNEGGETRIGTKEILEPTIESLRVDPELMRDIQESAPGRENTAIRPTGQADVTSFTESGLPKSKLVAAGLMPGKVKPKSLGDPVTDEAARKAGYNIFAAHSTNADNFNEFKTSGLSAHFGTEQAALDRAEHLRSFSEDVVGRGHKKARVIPVALKIENPLELPDLAAMTQNERGEIIPLKEAQEAWLNKLSEEDRNAWERPDEYEGDVQDQIQNEYGDFPRAMSWESDTDFSEFLLQEGLISKEQFWDVQYDKDAAVELLKEQGYDGIRYKNDVEDAGSDSYIVFDPSQVKLREATRDNSGNEIPASERFNPKSNDVRFMPGKGDLSDFGKSTSIKSKEGELAGFEPDTKLLFGGRGARGFKEAEQEGRVFRGKYDNRQRFEIDDSKAKVRPIYEDLKAGAKGAVDVDSISYAQNPDGTFTISARKKGAKTTKDFVQVSKATEQELREIFSDKIVEQMKKGEGQESFVSTPENDFAEAKEISVDTTARAHNATDLGQILDHPEFFKNYPYLKNLPVVIQELPKGNGGYVTRGENGTMIVLADNLSGARLKKVVLHELQHVIQEAEEFAKGTGLEHERKLDTRQVANDREAIQELTRDLAALKASDEYKNAEKEFAEANYSKEALAKRNAVPALKRSFEIGAKLRELAMEYNIGLKELYRGKIGPEEAKEMVQPASDDKLLNRYLRSAGEIESRDVEARSELSPEERGELAPFSSSFIPKEDAIVRFLPGNKDEAEARYPLAKGEVDGMTVRDEIPNEGSIGSSLGDYTVLKGVREFPIEDLPGLSGRHYSVPGQKKIDNLAEQIKESNEINPLIVAIDAEGPYILEGWHRGEALFKNGKKKFPALVVIDEETAKKSDEANLSPGSDFGFIGIVDSNGAVSTKRVPFKGDMMQGEHAEIFGNVAGKDRFRYDPFIDEIVWTREPSEEAKQSAQEWVAKKFPESQYGKLAPGSARKTWFVRDGKRVYHRRGEGGKFVSKDSEKLPLANMGRVGVASSSDTDEEPLTAFK